MFDLRFRLIPILIGLLLWSPVGWSLVTVRVDTVIGSFDIDMREDTAPATVNNFLNYVRDRDYDNMFFHRSVPNFIVQTGGFSFIGGEFLEVPEDPPVINEFNLSNIRSTVAMAKLGGDPNSATSQWFINLADNSTNLDSQNGGFTVFGEITESDMAIADAIGDVDNAIPGVEIFIIEGDKTPPMSETSFTGNFTDLPALDFDPALGIPIDPNGVLFDPDTNLVLVNSVREVGADMVVNQTSLNFGAVDLGSSRSDFITLTNKGLEDLTIEIDDAFTGDPGFSVSNNACTAPVPINESCTITFQFTPLEPGDDLAASIGISSNDTDRPDITINLSGDGTLVPEPRITTNPADLLDLGAVAIGGSGSGDITVKNIGSVPLINTVSIAGEDAALFSQNNDCGSVNSLATCTITVTFTPVAGSSATADLVIASNDPSQPTTTISLKAKGAAPDIELSQTSLVFEETLVGFMRELIVDVRNVGNSPLEINPIVSGDADPDEFIIEDDCDGPVQAGGNCSLQVTFLPTSEGVKSATVTINSNDPIEPSVTLDLVGEGLVPDVDLPPDLVFGVVVVNTFPTGQVALSNLGNGALIVSSITLGGNNADEFLVEDFCDLPVNPGNQCTINLTFRPTSEGEKNATLTVNTNDPDEPNAVSSVTGTAMGFADPAPQISTEPDFLEFETESTGDASVQEITILNKVGTSDLLIESVAITGTDAVDFSQTNNCSTVEPITGSCTVTVTFLAETVGDKSANLSVSSNDPVRPIIFLSLAGEAIAVPEPDIALLSVIEFGDLGVGTQATERLALTNEGLEDLQIDSIVLSGADAADFPLSDDCPDTLKLGEGCTLTVIFSPTEKGVKNAEITVTSNDPDEGIKTVSISATGADDSDRVNADTEDGHPNKNIDGRGDGNNDGIADALQSNVTSLPDIFGNYVTVVSPNGTRLVDVRAIENPSPLNAPTGLGTEVRFDQGFFEYSLKEVVGPVTVTLIFPVDTEITNYFKFVPIFPGQIPQWIPFNFDGLIGAEFVDNLVTLHLEDGSLGDADLEENGTIVDPGGPALIVPLDLSTSSSGGCSVSTRVVPIHEAAGWWLVFGLIGWLGAVCRRRT